MAEAISDTGPPLHLTEIGRLRALKVFRRIVLPPLVAEELERYGVDLSSLGPEVRVETLPVPAGGGASLQMDVRENGFLQPADTEILALARMHGSRLPVLTDDLALRRQLEAEGGVPVGTFGVLVRARRVGLLSRPELDEAVDALFTTSTLHLSRAFRRYLAELLADIP